jgi:hypothetical protein
MTASRSEEGERWYYAIEPDGSLRLQRMVGCWVLQAGCIGTEFWYMRAAHGVWVAFRDGRICVTEREV